jgi:hypothetical protein
MSPLVPICRWWTAADTTIQAHMNELHAFFDISNGGLAQHWVLKDTVSDNGNVTGFLIEQGDQQATLTLSGEIISCVLDPQGTKNLVADLPSGDAAPSVDLTRSDSVYSTRGVIAEYPDAVLFLLENTAQNFWLDGGHFGIIYSPFNSNDEDLFITGHGCLGRNPLITTSTSGTAANAAWISGSTAIQSQIRAGQTAWVKVSTPLVPSGGGLLNGNLRFPPVIIRTQADSGINTEVVIIGTTKYIRIADTSRGHRTVYTAIGSDQAWQSIIPTVSVSPLLFLWNKTVVP